MSTRASIVIKDKYNTLYFYRHSDGYPEETMKTLNKFLELIKEGKLRDNPSQCAGWLVILGAIEYQTIQSNVFIDNEKPPQERNDSLYVNLSPTDWKVGAYEPTTGIHKDVSYVYTIDLDNREIIVERR